MRTTIDLSDDLFRKLKAVSSLQGLSLKQFISRALERELDKSSLNLERHRVGLPIIRSKRPGSVRLTPEKIAAVLEAEDLSVSC